MDFQKRKLADLIPAEYNPRKALKAGDPEYIQIERSIAEFGYVDPIIINHDNTIIGGHQRATVLRDLGVQEVDVVVLDIPKDKEQALNIALNKIAGRWDEQQLLAVLQQLKDADYDVSLTGFDGREIAALLRRAGADGVEDDGFDVDQAYTDATGAEIQRGGIWRLGEHRLMCGDATSADDLDALMAGAEAGLYLTGPPYNVDYEGRAASTIGEYIKNDNMADTAFLSFLTAAFSNAHRVSAAGAAAYIFHADTEGRNFRTAYDSAGWTTHSVIIWVKQTIVMGHSDYHWRHEPIIYGWKPGAQRFFIKDRTQETVQDAGERPNYKSMRKPELVEILEKQYKERSGDYTTVQYFDNPARSLQHPTMKPLPLIAKLITNSTKEEHIILDTFGGSGSTLIAAQQLHRRCYMMELDPKYVEVILKRWQAFTGTEPVREA